MFIRHCEFIWNINPFTKGNIFNNFLICINEIGHWQTKLKANHCILLISMFVLKKIYSETKQILLILLKYTHWYRKHRNIQNNVEKYSTIPRQSHWLANLLQIPSWLIHCLIIVSSLTCISATRGISWTSQASTVCCKQLFDLCPNINYIGLNRGADGINMLLHTCSTLKRRMKIKKTTKKTFDYKFKFLSKTYLL